MLGKITVISRGIMPCSNGNPNLL